MENIDFRIAPYDGMVEGRDCRQNYYIIYQYDDANLVAHVNGKEICKGSLYECIGYCNNYARNAHMLTVLHNYLENHSAKPRDA